MRLQELALVICLTAQKGQKPRVYNTFVKTTFDKKRFVKLFISLFTIHLKGEQIYRWKLNNQKQKKQLCDQVNILGFSYSYTLTGFTVHPRAFKGRISSNRCHF